MARDFAITEVTLSNGPVLKRFGSLLPTAAFAHSAYPCQGLLTPHPELLPVYFTSTGQWLCAPPTTFYLKERQEPLLSLPPRRVSQQPESPRGRRRQVSLGPPFAATQHPDKLPGHHRGSRCSRPGWLHRALLRGVGVCNCLRGCSPPAQRGP